MKLCYLLLFTASVLFTFPSFAQMQQGKFLTTGTLRLRNYYESQNQYKTWLLGVTNKTGYLITKSIAVGTQIGYTHTHEKVYRFAYLQQGNSQWYERGFHNQHSYALGVFADKYFSLAKKLYLTVGVYGQYVHEYDKETGDYYDQDGSYVGISYIQRVLRNQVASAGLSNSVVYFLNDRVAFNCLLTSLDLSFYKSRAFELDLQSPLMNLGIQYHFPK